MGLRALRALTGFTGPAYGTLTGYGLYGPTGLTGRLRDYGPYGPWGPLRESEPSSYRQDHLPIPTVESPKPFKLYRVRRGYRIKFCEHDDNRTVQVLALARYYGGCPNLEFEHVRQFGKISPYLNPKSLTLIPISLQSLDSTMKFINIHNQ